MSIAEDIDEIIERHYNMVVAAYKFFGHEAPKSRMTHSERDDCNHFVQFSVAWPDASGKLVERTVLEITTELRNRTLTVKIHNFVVEVMEVFSVSAERK